MATKRTLLGKRTASCPDVAIALQKSDSYLNPSVQGLLNVLDAEKMSVSFPETEVMGVPLRGLGLLGQDGSVLNRDLVFLWRSVSPADLEATLNFYTVPRKIVDLALDELLKRKADVPKPVPSPTKLRKVSPRRNTAFSRLRKLFHRKVTPSSETDSCTLLPSAAKPFLASSLQISEVLRSTVALAMTSLANLQFPLMSPQEPALPLQSTDAVRTSPTPMTVKIVDSSSQSASSPTSKRNILMGLLQRYRNHGGVGGSDAE